MEQNKNQGHAYAHFCFSWNEQVVGESVKAEGL